MALLRTAVQHFSNDSLKAGFLAAFYERGMAETLANTDFKPFQGDSHRFVVQTGRATGASVRDPFNNTAPPSGVGSVTTFRVYVGQMLRDFLMPIHAVKLMEDNNDQTVQQAKLSADGFFAQWLEQFFHGDGSYQLRTAGTDADIIGNNLNGLDFWLDQYCGKFQAGSLVTTSTDNVLLYNSRFAGQKVFATATGLPSADPADWETLTYEHVDNLVSLIKGPQQGLVIISNRKTYIRFLQSLRASGGNTQSMLMGEDKIRVPEYNGIPWLISDTIGAEKAHADGADTTGANDETLTIAGTGADDFIGWSDIDVGRVITVAGARYDDGNASAAHATATDDNGNLLGDDQTRISTITDNRTVETVHDALVDTAAAAELSSDPVNVIWVLRLGTAMDPICALYAADAVASEESYNIDMGEYYGTINGFDVRRVGEVQAGGAYHLYRTEWDGQFVNENPFNFARLTQFKLS